MFNFILRLCTNLGNGKCGLAVRATGSQKRTNLGAHKAITTRANHSLLNRHRLKRQRGRSSSRTLGLPRAASGGDRAPMRRVDLYGVPLALRSAILQDAQSQQPTGPHLQAVLRHSSIAGASAPPVPAFGLGKRPHAAVTIAAEPDKAQPHRIFPRPPRTKDCWTYAIRSDRRLCSFDRVPVRSFVFGRGPVASSSTLLAC
jgi:hypothetical protein